MIDICMTAVRRPELIERTLDSFLMNLFLPLREECRLIMNIDPVGDDISSEEIMKQFSGYFSRSIFNLPKTPNFAKAFKWCWEQVEASFIFHLEDDWELLRPIDLQKMLDLMGKYPELMVLRLPFSPTTETNKSWGHFLPWNGEFFEVPEDVKGLLGFCGHPSLIKRTFVAFGLKMLDGVGNPEKQLKWKPDRGLGVYLSKYRYGVFSEQNKPRAVRDIGQEWRMRNGWKKKGLQAIFTEWERE